MPDNSESKINGAIVFQEKLIALPWYSTELVRSLSLGGETVDIIRRKAEIKCCYLNHDACVYKIHKYADTNAHVFLSVMIIRIETEAVTPAETFKAISKIICSIERRLSNIEQIVIITGEDTCLSFSITNADYRLDACKTVLECFQGLTK